MIFIAKNASTLQWTLMDDQTPPQPINDAVVTGTLYSGRSIVNPDVYPGTPVPPIVGLNLAYVPLSAGIYEASIDDSLDPPRDLTGYVLVIDASILSIPVYHKEEASRVVISEMASDIDLVAIEDVKSWLGINQDNTDNDSILQILITGFSRYVLTRTGRDSFNSVQHYIEVYDGNGRMRIFTRNTPITQLNSVTVGAYSIPISTSLITPGVYIEQYGRSLALRVSGGYLLPPQNLYPYRFLEGQGNVQIDYLAGYSQIPEDLYEACMKAIAINYVRKDRIDVASKGLAAGAGTSESIVYRNWALPPEIEYVLDYYSRYARP